MRIWLYYIFILHQTTTASAVVGKFERCIISSFYIKPQHLRRDEAVTGVVLYLHSTSNHNDVITMASKKMLYYIFILHQTTTLRVCKKPASMLYYIFILHQTTTRKAKKQKLRKLYYIFILHQTTTYDMLAKEDLKLYYIFILHQTTTRDCSNC